MLDTATTERVKAAAATGPGYPGPVLALDLATVTGAAIYGADGRVVLSKHEFREIKGAHPGDRWHRFTTWLTREDNRAGGFAAVFYESTDFLVSIPDKQGNPRGPSIQNARVKFGFEAHLLRWCRVMRGVPVEGLAPSTCRKAFCKTGRAKKDDVIEECRRRGYEPPDDNAADAMAVLAAGLATFALDVPMGPGAF